MKHIEDFSRGGGYSPEKGLRRCAALKDPPFHAFSVVHNKGRKGITPFKQDPHLNDKCKILPLKSNISDNMAIFSSRSSDLASIVVKKLKTCVKYQLSIQPATVFNQNPFSLESEPHIPTKNKVVCSYIVFERIYEYINFVTMQAQS